MHVSFGPDYIKQVVSLPAITIYIKAVIVSEQESLPDSITHQPLVPVTCPCAPCLVLLLLLLMHMYVPGFVCTFILNCTVVGFAWLKVIVLQDINISTTSSMQLVSVAD